MSLVAMDLSDNPTYGEPDPLAGISDYKGSSYSSLLFSSSKPLASTNTEALKGSGELVFLSIIYDWNNVPTRGERQDVC